VKAKINSGVLQICNPFLSSTIINVTNTNLHFVLSEVCIYNTACVVGLKSQKTKVLSCCISRGEGVKDQKQTQTLEEGK